MTSELKCPFCQQELRNCCAGVIYTCSKPDSCPHEQCYGSKELWQALIQAKQDLEIARQTLLEIRMCTSCGFDFPPQTPWEIIADKALKQIDHRE